MESISDLVREHYEEKKEKKGPESEKAPTKPSNNSIGEIAEIKYKGYDININDLMDKIKNKQKLGLPITKIMKKRAEYQRYLENKDKKSNNESIIQMNLPTLEFPNIDFNLPNLSYDLEDSNKNKHTNKDKGKSGENMFFNPQHS